MSSTTATTNIRYIVLSDLHLGQDRSVLTAVDADEQPTAEKTEPALEALMNCLQYLVEQNTLEGNEQDRPTLILLGDIIEQAFTNIDVAGPVFQGFVEKWRERGGRNPIFDKVVFIPGNHDHNMWEFTRAYQYWKSLSEWSEKAAQEPRSKLSSSPTSRHATELREGYTGNQDLIGLLINRQLAVTPELPVEIYYPTFALGSGKRAVLFNHGHYFESLYQLMSTLLPYVTPGASPQALTAEDIERNNFAWLDFVWSTLGRQGDFGHEIERLYDSLANPAAIEGAVSRVLTRLIKNYVHDPEHIRWKILIVSITKVAVGVLRPELETVSSSTEVLSRKTIKTMREYVEGPLRKQIDSDKGGLSQTTDRTLVFGHTHKPFHKKRDADYPIDVYNTGGWVIDPLIKDEQPLRGASCLVLNEQLDITSIQFYRQTPGGKYEVTAESLDETSVFHKSIVSAIQKDKESGDKVFEKFSNAVAASVRARLALAPGR